jgi:hypothetical protein
MKRSPQGPGFAATKFIAEENSDIKSLKGWEIGGSYPSDKRGVRGVEQWGVG